jgi:hypothetical protein
MMKNELILFETHIKPSNILKTLSNFEWDDKYVLGIMLGKVLTLYMQGFLTKATRDRYEILINKAQSGELKLRPTRKIRIRKSKCQKK